MPPTPPPVPPASGASLPVPLEPALSAVLDGMPQPDGPAPTLETIPLMRAAGAAMPMPPIADVIGDQEIDVEDRLVPGPAGAPELEITVLRPRHLTAPVPGLYNIHGGGMITGHRAMDTPRLVALVEELGVVAVNVEYRLAPEHPHPAPVEDC